MASADIGEGSTHVSVLNSFAKPGSLNAFAIDSRKILTSSSGVPGGKM